MTNPLKLLSGIRIVSFTQFLFGPAAAQYLCDMGAEVIKVEPPSTGAWERSWSGGNTYVNGVSACFMATHRNVRSLTLDLKSPQGQEAARRLIGTADVVISNYRPGVMERLGLGYEQVRSVKPDIIYASGSGFGGESPYRHLPGQDLIIQALSGMIWVGGQEGLVPRPAGAAVVDQHAGLLLATGILGALLHRTQTGEGQTVDVTMIEAALDLQLEPLVYFMNGGHVERPHEAVGSAFHQAPYGVYPTRTGHVVLSLGSLETVSQALDKPGVLSDFDDPEGLMEHRDEIYRVLADILCDQERDEVISRLQGHGVWCAPVLDYAEALDSAPLVHLDPVLNMSVPGVGQVKVLRHPIRYGSGQPVVKSAPPELGQDSQLLLRELGYADDDIESILGNDTAHE